MLGTWTEFPAIQPEEFLRVIRHNRPFGSAPVSKAASPVTQVTEPARCPACRSQEWSLRFRDLRDRLHGTPGTFDVWECTVCRVLRLESSRVEDPSGYPPEYYAYAQHQQVRSSMVRRLRSGAVDAVLPKLWQAAFFPTPGVRVAAMGALRRQSVAEELLLYSHSWSRSLLDIGCGSGQFLAGAHRLGFKATGLERDPHGVTAARLAGVECAQGSVETLGGDERTYDIIRLSHVLEHLGDPLRSLRLLRERLAAGGVLAIGVPNARGVVARYFEEDWFQLDPPRHVWGFGPDNLLRLLNRAGLSATGVWHRSSPRLIYFSFVYQMNTDRAGAPPDEPTHVALQTCAELAQRLDSSCQGDTITVAARVKGDS